MLNLKRPAARCLAIERGNDRAGRFSGGGSTMGLFALFNSRRSRSSTSQRCQVPSLSPRRLERRRVLDAGAAELLLGSLADAGEYVQTGESLALQEGESGQETNLAPANVELTLSANVIFENEVLQLGVTFEDPNEESDTHTVTIDWGDGTPTETILLDTGDRFLKTSHRYLDDNPTSTPLDFSTIRVSVFDAAGEQATAAARVQVTNVAPFNVHLEPVARASKYSPSLRSISSAVLLLLMTSTASVGAI